jgi:hypothetical protein
MANPLDSSLQRALAIRLNLQISLSQLPLVEEWMDVHLERWLDHVPMPPEMPDGFVANFLVAVGADLERLWWGAYGHPRGFVPKMAEYFRLCGMSKADEQVLDSIGLTLEPELVGTWVSVRRGRITTGWHFWDEHSWDKIEPLFGEHGAKEAIRSWVAAAGVTKVERFTQAIGQAAGEQERSDVPYSEIEFALPGVAIDDQLEALGGAWQRFTGVPLPSAVPDAFSAALTPGFAIAVRIAGGGITKVTAVSPSLGNDVVATLCAATGVGYSEKLGKIASALSAESAERVEFGVHAAGGPPEIEVYVEPTEAPHKPVRSAN